MSISLNCTRMIRSPMDNVLGRQRRSRARSLPTKDGAALIDDLSVQQRNIPWPA
jgi:hypothetical protein